MNAPMPFTQFAAEVLRVKLTPAQRVLALVAFDGIEPASLEGTDRDLARSIFGDVDTVPALARAVLVAVCGARAGKSYVICALRALHLALTVPIDTLAPGEVASAVLVAPDLRLARQTLRYATGAAKGVQAIAKRISAETSDSFTLRRENGREVVIECLPATRGGSALRGRSLVCAVLDESAFFRDDSYQVNDAELFRAVAPRVMPGGHLIVASTPWAEAGLLFEQFSANHGHPTTALAAHAPTTLLRPDARTTSMVERERERDPDTAAREFDAEFMTAGSGLFFDPATIDRAVSRERTASLPHDPAAVAAAGADFGFRSDSSALAVVQRADSVVELAALDELRPQRGSPLLPSAVVGQFATVAKGYGQTVLIADSHYVESIREHLMTHGLALDAAPEGQAGKVETYLHLRALLNEGRLSIPYHPRLIAQLKAIVSKPQPGGGLQITSPRRSATGHGDLVSALVLACWGVRGRRAGIDGALIDAAFTTDVKPLVLEAAA